MLGWIWALSKHRVARTSALLAKSIGRLRLLRRQTSLAAARAEARDNSSLTAIMPRPSACATLQSLRRWQQSSAATRTSSADHANEAPAARSTRLAPHFPIQQPMKRAFAAPTPFGPDGII